MIRKAFLFLALALSAGSLFVAQAYAQSYTQTPATQTLPQETIVSFSSDITVNPDNSVDVIETIVYNTGPTEHHGIYQDILPVSSQDRNMNIGNVTVTDESGTPYIFTLSNSGKYFRIKIGDPNVTFLGQKTYVIHYHATRAVAQFPDFDEIYWNVTGNGWIIPISQAQASIHLPTGASSTQSACYYGPEGGTQQCQSFSVSSLAPYEGLTVAVGFPKGFVTPYTAADDTASFFDKYLPWIIGGLLPIITFTLSLWYWYRKGRDPKGRGVIIPEYDVPDGLTPMEVGGIAYEKVAASQISAEIIYLATKGYLKIQELDEKLLGFIKKTDYELIKLKDAADLPNEFDRKLMQGLFSAGAKTVKLSDLKNKFYTTAAALVSLVLDALLKKEYYKNLGRMKSKAPRFIVILFLAIWVSTFFGGFFNEWISSGDPLPIILGIFLSVIIYGIVSYFNPAKTEKGVAAKEYILGLKQYLQIAEKDRLLFHDAPEKKPEVFEKLLPYAMVLGVANIWAKEFEGIYKTPPSWYAGPNNTAFNAIVFTNNLSNFSGAASSSLSSSPGGSGSGGGGFSGGGGGGGGGGGW